MGRRKILHTATSWALAGLLIACDATIHEYPQAGTSLVVLELNIDRTPPAYHKEIIYDEEWNRTERDLAETAALPYMPEEEYDMRIIVDIYQGNAENHDLAQRVQRRILYAPNDALPPQDTLHAYLPHGNYHVLAWADYVRRDGKDGSHYQADDLAAILTDTDRYPANTHMRSTAAGSTSFTIDFTRTPEGYPLEEGRIAESRIIRILLERPSGRYRLVASDYDLFTHTGTNPEGLSARVVYQQFVSTGFNIATGQPNRFEPSYAFGMEAPMAETTDDGSPTLAIDYVFAAQEGETNIVADLYLYDREGREVNRCQGIRIPIRRNHETVVRGHFLTRRQEAGNGVSIDEGFDGEYVVGID